MASMVISGGVMMLLEVPPVYVLLGSSAVALAGALVYALVIRPKLLKANKETFEEELERRRLALELPSPPRVLRAPVRHVTRRAASALVGAAVGAAETYLPPRVQAALNGARRASYAQAY